MKRTIINTKRTFTARKTKPTTVQTIMAAISKARAVRISFAFFIEAEPPRKACEGFSKLSPRGALLATV
jgi:hypothetical protein